MTLFPPNWALARLGDICTINPPQDANLASRLSCSFVPMAAVEAETGQLDASDVRPIAALRGRSFRSFLEGDVLVAKITPSMENGKAAVAKGLKDGLGFGSTEFHVLRPEPGIDSKYILDFVLQRTFRAEARRHMTGTAGQLRVPADFLREAPIPVPPTAEQARIVACMDERFVRLEAAKKSLAQAAVRTRVLYASLLEASISESGPRVPLGHLVAPGRKAAYGVLQPGPHVEGGVPIVRVGDLAGPLDLELLKRIAPAIAARYPRTRLSGGEVLLSIVGTIGRSAVAPDWLAGANVARAVAVIPVREGVSPHFIAAALARRDALHELTRLAHEVARKTLNLEDVRSFEVPVPDPVEQQRIVAKLERQRSLVEALCSSVGTAEQRADALRRAILERAFRGELVPQDAADEPASVLLERIRAERAGSAKQKRRRVPA